MRPISAFRRYCRRYRLLEHHQRPHRSRNTYPFKIAQSTHQHQFSTRQHSKRIDVLRRFPHHAYFFAIAQSFQTHRRSSTLSTSYLFLHKTCSKCAIVRADCRLRAHSLKGGDPILRVLRRTAPRRLSTKPFNTISTPFPTFDSVLIARFIGDID